MTSLKRIIGVAAIAVLLTIPVLTVAKELPREVPQQADYRSSDDIIAALKNIFQIIYILFFAIASIMIIWAAFTYLTAGGEEEKVKAAKSRIFYAIVAIIIALLASSVPFIVRNFLGSSPLV